MLIIACEVKIKLISKKAVHGYCCLKKILQALDETESACCVFVPPIHFKDEGKLHC